MAKIHLFLLLSLLITSAGFGQQTVPEGTFTYKISTNSVDPNSALAKSLNGATFTVFVKGPKSRTEMLSSLGSEATFFDSRNSKGHILRQYSGQKLMISLTAANFDQKNSSNRKMKFRVDEQIIKMHGYNCKKAIGESASGKTIEVFFTPDIKTENNQYDNAFPQLGGLPVQYELQSGKLTFIYTLTNVSYDAVPAATFDIPKAGYRFLTYEEAQQLKSVDN